MSTLLEMLQSGKDTVAESFASSGAEVSLPATIYFREQAMGPGIKAYVANVSRATHQAKFDCQLNLIFSQDGKQAEIHVSENATTPMVRVARLTIREGVHRDRPYRFWSGILLGTWFNVRKPAKPDTEIAFMGNFTYRPQQKDATPQQPQQGAMQQMQSPAPPAPEDKIPF